MALALPAQTFTNLYTFCPEGYYPCTDGEFPTGSLVQATNGGLYGATLYGGGTPVACDQDRGCGSIFEITPSGSLTTLYSFCTQRNCADGVYPNGLIQAADSDFYGTTNAGGVSVYPCDDGCGAIFRISLSGVITTLHRFCSQASCADGAFPEAGLVQAANGDFYGTTSVGGIGNACSSYFLGCGTVFKITPSGVLTTLHSFCESDCADGAFPEAALVQAANGDFYGTTLQGGTGADCGVIGLGCGTVFKIDSSGVLTTLHSFCTQSQCEDGGSPSLGALIQATNGDFYGTAGGGGNNVFGTVFKMTPGGALTTLHSFFCAAQNFCPNGSFPDTGLVQATDGDFYGTTAYGGDNCCGGTVFKMTPSGTLTTLYTFNAYSGPESISPNGLIQDTNGEFYGTTSEGGSEGLGTVFSLSDYLGPFVKTEAPSGEVGSVVQILGTNLTGTTSVTFNGTPAVIKSASSSLVVTTVPAGATSGRVEVVTASGTLLSNAPFVVLP